MRKLSAFLLAAAILLLPAFGCLAEDTASSTAAVQAEINTVRLTYNGSDVNAPIIKYNDRTYVPLRQFCSIYGAKLDVDSQNNEVDITKSSDVQAIPAANTANLAQGSYSIAVVMNPYVVKYSGIHTFMESFLYDSTTYVPVRYISELFGKNVEWSEADNTVIVTDKVEPVIGGVNGEKIYENEFEYFYISNIQEAAAQGSELSEEQIESVKQQVYDIVVNRHILLGKAAATGTALDSSELYSLNSYLDNAVSTNGGVENVKALLQRNSVDFYDFLRVFREDAIINKLADKLTLSAQADEAEIMDYYENNKSAFVIPESIVVKHILIMTSDDNGVPFAADKKEEARQKAQSILDRVKAGDDFDSLMKENSQDPGLAVYPDGYTFGRGETVKEFEDAAFALNPGEVSGLVETSYGFHIIKLLDKTDEKQESYEEVRDSIKQELDMEAKQEYFNQVLQQFRSESTVNRMVDIRD